MGAVRVLVGQFANVETHPRAPAGVIDEERSAFVLLYVVAKEEFHENENASSGGRRRLGCVVRVFDNSGRFARSNPWKRARKAADGEGKPRRRESETRRRRR